MSDYLLVSKVKTDLRIAVIKQNHLWQFFYESVHTPSHVDEIYIGRIKDITKAFIWVDIGREALVALRPSPANKNLNVGGKILVQVRRDALEDNVSVLTHKEKNLRVTTAIHLAGRFCIYHPDHKGIFFSKHLEQRHHERLLPYIKGHSGFTLRAHCAFLADGFELLTEVKQLTSEWEELSELLKTRDIGLLKKALSPLERLLRDLDPSQEVIFDDLSVLNKSKNALKDIYPAALSKMRIANLKEQPLFETFGIHDEWESLYSNFIPLATGGNLYIEETATATTIDINSIHESALHVNIKAIPFILKQIRLRQLSGNILIDFIRVPPKEKQKIMSEFERSLKLDNPQNLKVMGWSRLGFFELQATRHHDSLFKQLTHACSHCDGQGRIKKAD